jgi:hypothetical protein
MIGAQKPSSLSYASKRLLDQPTDSSYGAVRKYEKRAPESLTGITEKASYASIERALIVQKCARILIVQRRGSISRATPRLR